MILEYIADEVPPELLANQPVLFLNGGWKHETRGFSRFPPISVEHLWLASESEK